MQEMWVQSLGWRRKWKTSPQFLPGKSHGQRSLVSPGGCKRVEHDLVTYNNSSKNIPPTEEL